MSIRSQNVNASGLKTIGQRAFYLFCNSALQNIRCANTRQLNTTIRTRSRPRRLSEN